MINVSNRLTTCVDPVSRLRRQQAEGVKEDAVDRRIERTADAGMVVRFDQPVEYGFGVGGSIGVLKHLAEMRPVIKVLALAAAPASGP